ncbi:hypothetical protein WDU94_004517, partial [Cyamophila willieti]
PSPIPNNPPQQQRETLPVPILINSKPNNKSNSNKSKNNSISSSNSNSNIPANTANGIADVSGAGVRGGKIKKQLVFRDVMANNSEVSLKDLSHPSLNEHLKNHNAATFKLVRTGKKCKFQLFHNNYYPSFENLSNKERILSSLTQKIYPHHHNAK